MKAITLWQPWASLIAEGAKTIETRSRRHPWRSAIGQTIAVHAALRKPEQARLGDWWCERTWGDEFGLMDESGAPRRVPLGAVVATCTLVDVVPMIDVMSGAGPDDHDAAPVALYLVPDALGDTALELTDRMTYANDPDHCRDVTDQLPFGDFAPGRWALLLADVRKCAPFPCRGRQGLWTLPDHVADNLVGWAA